MVKKSFIISRIFNIDGKVKEMVIDLDDRWSGALRHRFSFSNHPNENIKRLAGYVSNQRVRVFFKNGKVVNVTRPRDVMAFFGMIERAIRRLPY